ncbi:MAG: helix-turn-helix transcriptional regulator [Microbacterium ginsengisoli]|nr:helix-turn-helix transcriptional regulator [Microbacterium ginsengisoli]
MSTITTWTLGELIAKSRRDAGYEQTDLAELVGVARNTISNYETGRSVPPFDVASRIARVCGVSLDWLAEMAKAPAEAEAFGEVRPKGLEPLTF